jgi:hypothetical protein
MPKKKAEEVEPKQHRSEAEEGAGEQPSGEPEVSEEAAAEMLRKVNQAKIDRVRRVMAEEGVEPVCILRKVPVDSAMTRWVDDTSQWTLRVVPRQTAPGDEPAPN